MTRKTERQFHQKRMELLTWFGEKVLTPIIEKGPSCLDHTPLESHIARVASSPNNTTFWEDFYEHVWRKYRLQKGIWRSGLEPEMEVYCDRMVVCLKTAVRAQDINKVALFVLEAAMEVRHMRPEGVSPVDIPDFLSKEIISATPVPKTV